MLISKNRLCTKYFLEAGFTLIGCDRLDEDVKVGLNHEVIAL